MADNAAALPAQQHKVDTINQGAHQWALDWAITAQNEANYILQHAHVCIASTQCVQDAKYVQAEGD